MNESSDQTCYKWTDEAITKLIQLRYEKREDFKTAGKNSKDVWKKIVLDLHLENQITADECCEQWSHLLTKFKEIESKISDGSCNEGLAWPHYNEMQSVISKLVACEDPLILSTGSGGNIAKIQFSHTYDDHALTEDELTEHRSNRRDRRDELDERYINAVLEGNRQLEAMHLTFEKQGDRFIELMAKFFSMFDV